MPAPTIPAMAGRHPNTNFDTESDPELENNIQSIAIEVPANNLQEVEEGLRLLRRLFETEIQKITARLGSVEKQLEFSNAPSPNCNVRPSTSRRRTSSSGSGSDEKIGQVESNQHDDKYTPVSFEESAWNIPLVLGLADVGLFDTVFSVVLVLLNLLMQGSFSVILLSEYFMGDPFDTKLQSAKDWRTSIAHDSRYLDLAGTSLVSRVCEGDGSLILSTVQATLIQHINDFLGLQTQDFAFNFWQPGTLLCMLCILLWSLCVYKETLIFA